MTFEVQRPPHLWQTESIVQLADHRRIYLTYEGPISNGRGEVANVLNGTIQWNFVSASRLEFLLIGANSFPDWRRKCSLWKTGQSASPALDTRWEMSLSDLA